MVDEADARALVAVRLRTFLSGDAGVSAALCQRLAEVLGAGLVPGRASHRCGVRGRDRAAGARVRPAVRDRPGARPRRRYPAGLRRAARARPAGVQPWPAGGTRAAGRGPRGHRTGHPAPCRRQGARGADGSGGGAVDRGRVRVPGPLPGGVRARRSAARPGARPPAAVSGEPAGPAGAAGAGVVPGGGPGARPVPAGRERAGGRHRPRPVRGDRLPGLPRRRLRRHRGLPRPRPGGALRPAHHGRRPRGRGVGGPDPPAARHARHRAAAATRRPPGPDTGMVTVHKRAAARCTPCAASPCRPPWGSSRPPAARRTCSRSAGKPPSRCAPGDPPRPRGHLVRAADRLPRRDPLPAPGARPAAAR